MGTSSPRQPRPCAESWSRTPAARAGPKAGGDRQRVDLDAIEPPIAGPRVDLIALDEALTALEARDRRKADVVRLRFFAGLSIEEAARALGVSVATANNDWAYARSWLRLAMAGGGPGGVAEKNRGTG